MTMVEKMLIALIVILAVPWLIWRLGRTERWAPLVVVQILTGIVLGPGLLGAAFPEAYRWLFTTEVIGALGGIATWGVMLFVWIAGIELDLHQVWQRRRDTVTTVALATGFPMLAGGGVAAIMLWHSPEWIGPAALEWQFVAAIGMACAVTALPILILFMEKLDILRRPLGQRVLRYASLEDIAVWALLALILLDFDRLGRQISFFLAFGMAAIGLRQLMPRLAQSDRWFLALVWLALCGLAGDWSGLHYMVGAFLAGTVLEAEWFGQAAMDRLRHHVLLILMPVFFLSTGLRTEWALGGVVVLVAAIALLAAAVGGRLAGVALAAHRLGWPPGEARLVGWLLQTKALILIIFASILLDRNVIGNETFTALVLMATFSTMLTIPMVTRGRSGAATHPAQ
ncbi:MAG TPA: cation:proton antiporter [Wenzhouxiangellaceae bacterium]|nr:cation:proton antiporter [Wenzhouxiangellaceae bacterium]